MQSMSPSKAAATARDINKILPMLVNHLKRFAKTYLKAPTS
jgi:hypothetical protein